MIGRMVYLRQPLRLRPSLVMISVRSVRMSPCSSSAATYFATVLTEIPSFLAMVGYIGVLSIPSLELELPVISQWDYPALKVAPCRYSGSLYQDNLIICAHNYASHFGKLKELQPGDIVLFTDMDEHVVTFQMVERETLNPMDAEGMEAGDWDLTLFTCTIGGQTRVTIRLERVEVFRNPETEEPAKSEK